MRHNYGKIKGAQNMLITRFDSYDLLQVSHTGSHEEGRCLTWKRVLCTVLQLREHGM